MKKVILLSLLCLMAFTMNAQRCAVLEFSTAVDLPQEDIDGIFFIFNSNFRPDGYTMIERTQINRAIKDAGYQRTDLTLRQRLSIGRNINASLIVVGDVNVFMDEYNMDIRVISVETGATIASEAASFERTAYRTNIQSLAYRLAAKLTTTSGGTMELRPVHPTTPQKRTEPYIIYGYLKVFPDDLGTFTSRPTQIIANLNQSQQYGYGSWRLPTDEELALMRANKIIGDGTYMTKKNPSGTVRLVTDKEKGVVIPAVPAGYVDLGLPSGTLWKISNENDFCSKSQAFSVFGNRMPTKEQLQELQTICQWTWNGSGYKVVGPSGEYIIFPAAGWRGSDGNRKCVGSDGWYWSSSPSGSDGATYLRFDSSKIYLDSGSLTTGSVRLVQNP